ncbi:MAG TPA: YihY/virulence factor BrkB family protein [Acidimicrobiales bacterium]|nr:YihY/virulence factor BrkB family protein [Acidimicrobiales bacterium]
MEQVQAVLRGLDGFQQRHPWAAFPFAVVKKYGDDQAGNQAALIAYYGFFSLFPLMLVAVTVLGIVLAHDPHLQDRVLHSALKNFPVIGTQLRNNVHSLDRTGLGLGLGLVGTFYGARGVASAAQNAFNHAWNVPKSERPGFPFNTLRSFGMIFAVGIGIVLSTALSSFGSGSHSAIGLRIAAYAVALIINFGAFWLGFRLGTAKSIRSMDMWLAAVIAAVLWQILQGFGTFLIAHELKNASEVYGTFAFVIGLLWWIYMQAQFTMYALEIDVVRARRLWPRSLVQPPLTEGDQKAYEIYVEEEKRRRPEVVDVHLDEPVERGEPVGRAARGDGAQR